MCIHAPVQLSQISGQIPVGLRSKAARFRLKGGVAQVMRRYLKEPVHFISAVMAFSAARPSLDAKWV
jgi:hypothetical protein